MSAQLRRNAPPIRVPVNDMARDFDGFQTKLFPTVVMHEPPPAVDPDIHRLHVYPKLNR